MAIRIRFPAIIRQAYAACSSITSHTMLAAGLVIRQRGSLIAFAGVSSWLGAMACLALVEGRDAVATAAGVLVGALALAFEVGRASLAGHEAATTLDALAARLESMAPMRADLDRREAEVAKRERHAAERVAMILAAEAAHSMRKHGRRSSTPPRLLLPDPLEIGPIQADDVLGKRYDTAE